MNIKKTCQGLAIILLSICLCLLILEMGVRLFVPTPYWQFHDFTSDWQLDKGIGWVQKPNLDVTDRTEFGWLVRFRTNKDGVTPATASRKRIPGKIRIMIFGDSTVVGRSVPYKYRVSTELQNFLQKKNLNVEVINAGVQGYGTDQSLLLMRRLLPLYHPDIVIYGFCQNDLGENQTSEAHGQAKPRFKLLSSGKYEIVPPLLKAEIDPGVTGLRKWIQSIALYRFLQPNILALRMKLRLLTNYKPNVTDELDKLYVSQESLNSSNWPLFEYLLKRMQTICNKNNAKFLFYSHPALQEVWDQYIKNNYYLKSDHYDRYAIENKLMKISHADHILFIPMIDWFVQHRSEGPFHLLPRDPHCNQTGYRLIAEKLTNPCVQLILKVKN